MGLFIAIRKIENTSKSITLTIKDIIVKSNQTSHWTFSGINVKIFHCELLSVYFNFLSPHKLHKQLDNTKMTIQNSTFGMLYLNAGTETTISKVHMNAEFNSSFPTLIIANRSTVIIRNCTFSNFFNENSPTILYAHFNATIIIEDSNFSNHHALKGMIHLHNGCVFKMSNSMVQESHAYSSGFSVFTFQQQIEATFQDAKFINNSAVVGGVFRGEIQCLVKFHHCTFTTNKGFTGGAIWTSGETSLILLNSLFDNNSALEQQSLFDALIPGSEQLMAFDESSVEHLYGKALGGSIHARQGIVLHINNTRFEDNKAMNGGAISLIGGTMNVHSSLFLHNQATREGGAIRAVHGTQLEVKQSAFQNNDAGRGTIQTTDKYIHVNLNDNDVLFSDGGGIHFSFDGQLILIDCIFMDNLAIRFGGALMAGPDVSVYLDNTNFTNNVALLEGGAINIQRKSQLRVTNCVFSENYASSSGGAIMGAIHVLIEIYQTKFKENNASSEEVINVGDRDPLFMKYSGFNKKKIGDGGSIAGIFNVTVEVFFSIFTKNMVLLSGAAISLRYNSSLLVNNSLFKGNYAVESGGTITMVNNATLEMYGTHFVANTAGHGGTILLMQESELLISRCTFETNIATNRGGAIAGGRNSSLEIHSSNFIGNIANYLGGSISVERNGSLYLAHSLFEDNFGQENGGAIIAQFDVHLNITQTVFTNNSATVGGAISCTDHGELFLDNCEFNHNSAQELGGAIFNKHAVLVRIDKSLFKYNMCSRDGGAIGTNTNISLLISNLTRIIHMPQEVLS